MFGGRRQTIGSPLTGDNPTIFDPPQHFLNPYLEKKEMKEQHIGPFGDALYRCVFNTPVRRKVIADLLDRPEKRLIIEIRSDLPDVHDIPWEIIKDPKRAKAWVLSGDVAFCRSVSQPFVPFPTELPQAVL